MEQLGLILVWFGFICCSISFAAALCLKRYKIALYSFVFVLLDSVTLAWYYTKEDNEINEEQTQSNMSIIHTDSLTDKKQHIRIIDIVRDDSVIKSDTIIIY